MHSFFRCYPNPVHQLNAANSASVTQHNQFLKSHQFAQSSQERHAGEPGDSAAQTAEFAGPLFKAFSVIAV